MIIEKSHVLREGLAAMIEAQQDMEYEVASKINKDILARIRKYRPDLILLDLAYDNHDKVTFVKSAKKLLKEAIIIGMQFEGRNSNSKMLKKIGIAGFVRKECRDSEFLMKIRKLILARNIRLKIT